MIVACVEAERTIDRSLDAMRKVRAEVPSEVIVVRPTNAALSARVRRLHPWVRLLSGPQEALVPKLWCRSSGAEALVPKLWAPELVASSGAVVAFCTAHCIAPPQWARALLVALDQGATGAGGALQLGPDTDLVGRTVNFLRYSAFMPPPPAGEVGEIPGDNAADLRTALERHSESLAKGFGEIEFHGQVHAEGGHLVSVPEATVVFCPTFSFGSFLRKRFLHGRRSGAYRVSATGTSRWRGVLAAPVVSFLLLGRIARQAARKPRVCSGALLGHPALLPLAAAGAAGEAWGALHATQPRVLQWSPT